jgi:hypothetical protein
MKGGKRIVFWLMVMLASLQFLHAMMQPHIIELRALKLRDQIDPNFGDQSPYFSSVLGFMRKVSEQWDAEKIFAALILILAITWRFLENSAREQPKTIPPSN